jgi:hypothetical protein
MRPPHLTAGNFTMGRPAWPYIERHGYMWIQPSTLMACTTGHPSQAKMINSAGWRNGECLGIARSGGESTGISCVFPK